MNYRILAFRNVLSAAALALVAGAVSAQTVVVGGKAAGRGGARNLGCVGETG